MRINRVQKVVFVRGLLTSLVIWIQGPNNKNMKDSRLYVTKSFIYPEKELYKSVTTSLRDDTFV